MPEFDANDLARRYLAGETLCGLSKATGLNTSTIRSRLVKSGVAMRSPKAAALQKRRDVFSVEEVCRRYNAGESISSLAKSLGVSSKSIQIRLNDAGIPLRSREESLRLSLVKRLNVDEIICRYTAGEPASSIAKSMDVGLHTISNRLINAGVEVRSREAAISLAKKLPIDTDEVVRRYKAGNSELAISQALGHSRSAIRRRLIEAGISVRSGSEAGKIRMRRMSPEQRAALADAAHAAVRGVPQSEEYRCKLALANEHRERVASPNERTLAEWLRARRLEVTPQKAVGRYNVDIALAESRIAVEIFGGNWHAGGAHARRYRPRLDYLMDRGWHPVIVWVTTNYRLAYPVAEQIIALHEARSYGESFGRQEHVIRGDGYMATVAQVKPHNGAIVLGYNPGNPNRGDDGRFR
jgi:very-short-patch-repair endonuclease